MVPHPAGLVSRDAATGSSTMPARFGPWPLEQCSPANSSSCSIAARAARALHLLGNFYYNTTNFSFKCARRFIMQYYPSSIRQGLRDWWSAYAGCHVALHAAHWILTVVRACACACAWPTPPTCLPARPPACTPARLPTCLPACPPTHWQLPRACCLAASSALTRPAATPPARHAS